MPAGIMAFAFNFVHKPFFGTLSGSFSKKPNNEQSGKNDEKS